MPNIKELDKSSEKWSRKSAVSSGDYQAGVQNPRKPWAESALNAENNYKSGVIQAANAGRYGSGIKSAGNSKWQERSVQVGPGRFAEGVQVAQKDWEAGFKPYHATIASLTLPPRGPKGSPQNLQRVQAVATALRAVFEKKGGK